MPRRQSKVDLTLFPFLSVLAGLIAVLMLFMMVTLGTRAIEASGAAPRAADTGDGIEGGISDQDYAQRLRDIERLEKALKQKLADLDELGRKQDDLLAVLEMKRDEKALAKRGGKGKGVMLGAPEEVQFKLIKSKGQAVTKKPIYVEVTQAGYKVHPDGVTYPAVTLHEDDDKDPIRVAPALKEFLEKVQKEGDKKYLLFILHPTGVPVYDNLRLYMRLRRLRIDTGTEPAPRDWKPIPDN